MDNENSSNDVSLTNNTFENDNENDNDWNLVETQPIPTSEESIPLGSISQSIIVGTLNSRLNEISQKMDTIIDKLDNLDNRIKNIEESNLNKSEYDSVIFNNPDIGHILNINDDDLEEIKAKLENKLTSTSTSTTTSTINGVSSKPIPISRPTSFSPNIYDNRYMGLKYISSNSIGFKSPKTPFKIPFSSPY
jgi:uncharacterized coiled-coil protein SlyX